MSDRFQPHYYGPGIELDENGDIIVPQLNQTAQHESARLTVSFNQTFLVNPNIDPVLLSGSGAIFGYTPSEPSQLETEPSSIKRSRGKSNLVDRTQKEPRHKPAARSNKTSKPQQEPATGSKKTQKPQQNLTGLPNTKKPRKPLPLYTCPKCGLMCGGQYNYNRHVNSTHKDIKELIAEGKSYRCPWTRCEKHFKDKNNAQRHGKRCQFKPNETSMNVAGPSN